MSIAPHYIQNIPKDVDEKIKEVISYFRSRNLSFYNLQDVKVDDVSQGKQRYIFVTVSIKVN